MRTKLSKIVAIALLAVAAVVLPLGGSASAASSTYYVSPSGSDSNPGSASAPWRTITKAFRALSPGDTLYVRGGTYAERVKLYAGSLARGSSSAPITVRAQPGERPVISGLLWLENADYWTVDGVNVTWSSTGSSNEHMVKFIGGVGWRLTNAEIWDAHSYAGLLVERGARDFRVDHNFIHDTHPSNQANQDHLIYVNNGHDGGGVIERNVLVRSANGRGVKLGPGSLSNPGTNNLVIRHNTFYANEGPSNVQLSGSSSNNQIYGNILVRPQSGSRNVTAWNLTGSNNVVRDNLWWDSAGVADSAFTNGGGNTNRDPRFANPAGNDFTPTDPTATNYGHTAPGDAAPPPPPPPPSTTAPPPPPPAPSTAAPPPPTTTSTTAAPTTTSTTAAPTTTTSAPPPPPDPVAGVDGRGTPRLPLAGGLLLGGASAVAAGQAARKRWNRDDAATV